MVVQMLQPETDKTEIELLDLNDSPGEITW